MKLSYTLDTNEEATKSISCTFFTRALRFTHPVYQADQSLPTQRGRAFR